MTPNYSRSSRALRQMTAVPSLRAWVRTTCQRRAALTRARTDRTATDSRAEYLRQRIAVEKKHCLETRAAGHVDEARLMLNEIKRLEHELHEHEQHAHGHGVGGNQHRVRDDMDDVRGSLAPRVDAQPPLSKKSREEDEQFDQLGSMMELDMSHEFVQSVPINVNVKHVPSEDVMQQSPPLTRVTPQLQHEELHLDSSMRDVDPDDEQPHIDQQLVDLLHARSLEYKSFAAKFNKSGNKSAALKYLKVGKTLEALHQRASRGEHIGK